VGKEEVEGFKGKPPHEIFQKYMEQVVGDPAYASMPDAHYDDGRIQWEAPSNRSGGKFKDTHQRRREWWTKKAKNLGISTLESQWISRVAKTIHPTQKKPCKKCGRVMYIRYVYPSSSLIKRLRELPFLRNSFDVSPLEDIYSLVTRLHDFYGDVALQTLPSILRGGKKYPAQRGTLEDWLKWLEAEYVPSEPRTLSPGAMSNAPDRFDGFHSFNRCCRSTADTGRTATNLRSYTTDRRVFEYWASGDWIAADRLMGILRRDFREEMCANGHPGPCQADHIGPISLGFNHHPHFQMLCSSCNSAKNNRMYPSDVAWLIEREAKGEEVTSWHSARLWNLCKGKVETREHALRLSKVLRDNRHSYMHALSVIAAKGHYGFLASLLELQHANHDVEFVGLRIVNHITEWRSIQHLPRETKYAAEQKARRSRIAFEELLTYFDKSNRNAFVVENAESSNLLMRALDLLATMKVQTTELDQQLEIAIRSTPEQSDERFRQVYGGFSDRELARFEPVRQILRSHMDSIGSLIASMWDNERFTRELTVSEQGEFDDGRAE
jgi:Alw26I/Eco31I/Esp3I family type II restriction endonuclease